MKSSFKVLIATIAACILTFGPQGAHLQASTPAATDETTDRDALVELYEAADGDAWTENRNWLTNAPLDRWHGVIANRSGRVTELDLSENELNGTIPAALGNLTYLEALDLSKNQLKGNIPPELGNLAELEALILYQNQLSGSIPTELDTLSKLQILALSGNNLRGPIPPELGHLANLRWLVLSDNGLTGSIPPQLGSLENLVWLYLWGNQLRGEIPPELGNLINLERLDLSYNNLVGTIPPALENLTLLEYLFLSENRFSGCIPEVWRDVEENDLEDANIAICSDWEALAALYEAAGGDDWLENENWLSAAPLGTWFGVTTNENERVIALELAENELRGPIPPELANLTRLEELNLARNRLRGDIPPELGNLSQLELLYLHDNQLDGTIPTELAGLSQLEQLALSWNRLNGTIPLQLGDLNDLAVLALSGNRLSGGIPPQLGNLVNLEMLALAANRLTGTIPLALDRLTRLEWLYLADNELDGCVPEAWADIEENDLDDADLPICTDRDALVALYEASVGRNWLNNENWLSNAPLKDWYGVTTDRDDRVIELDLSENGLRGTVPPQLGRLANLTHLNLFDNELRGEIPPELGNLTNLKWLYLSENNLRGELPVELANLRRLEHLLLGANSLSGTVPPQLGKLVNLTLLSLADNKLKGPIPAELGKLTNLEALYLWQNELSGPIPPELGNLTKLEGLHLSSNQLSGAIPSALGKLTRLTEMVLWGNRLSGEIPAELGNLTRLTGLGLAENNLSGEIPLTMGNLAKLEELYLADNRLSGCLPTAWEDVEGNDFDELDLPFCALIASTAATGGTLTSAQIFASVSPAIPYIQTWTGSGSGVLIDGGYIVTNAHVVWPYNAVVRVFFPDGPDLRNVPVIGWDLLTDLAVLGPVDVDVQPARMLDGEALSTGSELYLIGYPGEVDAYPETTMTRGILSRLREWEQVGITFFQTDASITGGQSGGALVSETGAVIGISGFKFRDEFGIAASSTDLLPRIDQLVAGRDPSGHGERRLQLGSGTLRHSITPRDYGDAYILHEAAGTRVEVEFGGAREVGLKVVDVYGNVIVDGEGAFFSHVTGDHGPLFLIFRDIPQEFTLSSSHRLLRFDDADRGKEIRVGQTVYGNIDYPTDVDYLFLELERGEKVVIEARSILADVRLTMWAYRGESLAAWVRNDSSGGGLFGSDALIVFEAPFAGEYILLVEDVQSRSAAPAGYMVAVARAGRTARLTPLQPLVSITTPINVRAGPGTNYAVMGTAAPGDWYVITGKNSAGDWWQVNYDGRSGWLYAPLVTAMNAAGVEVVAAPRR